MEFIDCPISPLVDTKVSVETCVTCASSGTCSVYWNHLIDAEEDELLAEEMEFAEVQGEHMKKMKKPVEIKGVRKLKHNFNKASSEEVIPKVYTQASAGYGYGWRY